MMTLKQEQEWRTGQNATCQEHAEGKNPKDTKKLQLPNITKAGIWLHVQTIDWNIFFSALSSLEAHGVYVHAGGRIVYTWEARLCGRPTTRIYVNMEGSLGRRPYCVLWEARQSGRPSDKSTLKYTEARLSGRPYCIHLGSPTMREAHDQDLHTHGRRPRPEALLCLMGSPTEREAR